jgi:hypothetical protein
MSVIAAPRPRRGRSFRGVALGLGALTLLAVAIAGLLYFRLLRYERVAGLHLPADTTAAARVDVEKVVLFEPVRKHLLSLVDELGPSAVGGSLPPRLERIRRHTKVELVVDLREIAVARGPSWDDWVVVLGGLFPKKGVIAGLSEVLRAEGILWTLSPDATVLSAPTGAALGQASDGCLVLASSADRLKAALPAQATHLRLGLSLEAPGSFAENGAIARAVAASPPAFIVPALRDLAGVERVSGELSLGSVVNIETQIFLRAGSDAAAMKSRMENALAGLGRLSAMLPGQDIAGERAALANASVEAAGPDRLVVRLPWDREAVDRGAKSLADQIRRWVQGGTARPHLMLPLPGLP